MYKAGRTDGLTDGRFDFNMPSLGGIKTPVAKTSLSAEHFSHFCTSVNDLKMLNYILIYIDKPNKTD
jgi:hypothetical protein